VTEEQITMLRRLIKDEIECAQIDGMEHGQWGWAEKQLDEGWKVFRESFTKEEGFIVDTSLDDIWPSEIKND